MDFTLSKEDKRFLKQLGIQYTIGALAFAAAVILVPREEPSPATPVAAAAASPLAQFTPAK
jgi:hypothetical protein